jgi:hypothetical protein
MGRYIWQDCLSVCAKVNRMAERNGIVVGSDLYEISNNKVDYRFSA